VFMALAVRHLDAAALEAALRSASPAYIAAAACAMGLVYVAQGLRWRVILSGAISPSRSLEWVVGSVAVNNVVPGRIGDVLRIEWVARGAALARTRAAASVVVDRGFDVLTLVAALALTYPFMHRAPWLDRVVVAAAALGVVVVIVFVAVPAYARRAGRTAGGRVRGLIVDAARSAGEMVHGRRALSACLLSVAAWLAWAVGAWLVARSLGFQLTPLELAFTTAVINLGVAIPSSPGFIGTYQWLGVSTLGLLGVGHVQAFAFSVLLHAVWYVPTTVTGAALAARKLPPLVVGAARRTVGNHAA
jgi:glycosyltransferase 2 family protein